MEQGRAVWVNMGQGRAALAVATQATLPSNFPGPFNKHRTVHQRNPPVAFQLDHLTDRCSMVEHPMERRQAVHLDQCQEVERRINHPHNTRLASPLPSIAPQLSQHPRKAGKAIFGGSFSWLSGRWPFEPQALAAVHFRLHLALFDVAQFWDFGPKAQRFT